MPVTPHPITITVKDTDNTTAVESAKCLVRNCTKKTTLDPVTLTNSSGIAIVDLANLPLAEGQTVEYSAGDIILIIAWKGTKMGEAHDGVRYVVTGTSKAQTLYLNPFPYKMKTEDSATQRLVSLTCSNDDASNPYYTRVWSFDDGELLRHAVTAAHNSQHMFFGMRGLPGRVIVERENQAVVVTGNFR
jgi:hypothetical protein